MVVLFSATLVAGNPEHEAADDEVPPEHEVEITVPDMATHWRIDRGM